MDNAKLMLQNLTYNAEIEIEKIKLPNEFSRVGLDIDPYRKYNKDISKYVYDYFDQNKYTIKIVSPLEVLLSHKNLYGQKIEISISFYEPCWRLEYIYQIFYDDTGEWTSYYCNFEETVEIEKAIENMKYITEYLHREIDDKFNAWLSENGIK